MQQLDNHAWWINEIVKETQQATVAAARHGIQTGKLLGQLLALFLKDDTNMNAYEDLRGVLNSTDNQIETKRNQQYIKESEHVRNACLTSVADGWQAAQSVGWGFDEFQVFLIIESYRTN